jgi:hypothetical protein
MQNSKLISHELLHRLLMLQHRSPLISAASDVKLRSLVLQEMEMTHDNAPMTKHMKDVLYVIK